MAASPVQPSKSLYSEGIRLGPDVSPFPTPPPKKVLPGFPNWKQPTSQHGTHASSSHNYVVLMEEEKLCFEGRLRNLHSTCKRTVFVQETESSHHIQQRAPLFPCIEGGAIVDSGGLAKNKKRKKHAYGIWRPFSSIYATQDRQPPTTPSTQHLLNGGRSL